MWPAPGSSPATAPSPNTRPISGRRDHARCCSVLRQKMRQFYEPDGKRERDGVATRREAKEKERFLPGSRRRARSFTIRNNKPFVTFAPFVVSSGGPISELQYDAS